MRVKLKKTGPEASPFLGGHLIVEKEKVGGVLQTVQPVALPESASSKTVEIKAPMVGTFYRAPSPEAAPFVDVNQVIEPGQVICIIEAMKLMNEIKSEVKGKILAILVDNADPVEFGQPMFLIEPL
jgi:acetyl-CoA carboxylase biotin carboxyl carrier protein